MLLLMNVIYLKFITDRNKIEHTENKYGEQNLN